MDIHARLAELSLTLPEVPKAVAAYVPALRSGNHIYVSGQLCTHEGKLIAEGRLPEVDLETAQHAARQCVLNGLAAVDGVLGGDWSRFERIVRLGVFVSSTPDFTLHHKVANGGSELLEQIFGEAGRHVRAAVGVAALPLNATVEVELLVAARE